MPELLPRKDLRSPPPTLPTSLPTYEGEVVLRRFLWWLGLRLALPPCRSLGPASLLQQLRSIVELTSVRVPLAPAREGPTHAPADRGLRPDRRLPDGRPCRQGRVDRLAVPAAVRLRAPASPPWSAPRSHGRWKIAPAGRRSRPSAASTATTRWCSKPSSRRPTGPWRSSTSCRPATATRTWCGSSRVDAAGCGCASELILRFDYGSIVPWVHRTDCGISATAGPDTVTVTTPVPLRGEDFTDGGRIRRSRPASGCRSASRTIRRTARGSMIVDSAFALQDTEAWWREWTKRCTYTGPYKDAVCGRSSP